MSGGRLPVATGKDAVRELRSAGFIVDRVVGSHHVMTFPNDPTRTETVPVHAGRDLKPGTLRSVIRQSGLTVEEFTELL
jgi:predicted RNA binding protein YcfA (HicA-like mRNA interferase family)